MRIEFYLCVPIWILAEEGWSLFGPWVLAFDMCYIQESVFEGDDTNRK